MSVMMGLRVTVDPARFEEVITANRERLIEISERGKEHGAIHHRFFANEAGGEILVVDEWPDAAAFQAFFDSSPDIGEMFGQAGVTGAPEIKFWRELDTPDKF
jgi:heme-degrading monooxygenase HmoA